MQIWNNIYSNLYLPRLDRLWIMLIHLNHNQKDWNWTKETEIEQIYLKEQTLKV